MSSFSPPPPPPSAFTNPSSGPTTAAPVPPPPPYVVPAGSHANGLVLPPGVKLSSPGKRLAGLLLSIVLMIVLLGIGYLVWAIIAWSRSTTPAKMVLRMKVIDAHTLQPASTGKMWMRQLVWNLLLSIGSSMTFGILGLVDAFMIFAGDKRQRLLDRMAGTYVVDDPDDAWHLKTA